MLMNGLYSVGVPKIQSLGQLLLSSSLIAVDVFLRKTYKLQREVGSDVLPKRRLAQKHQEELANLVLVYI
jgi:hypothetical protein